MSYVCIDSHLLTVVRKHLSSVMIVTRFLFIVTFWLIQCANAFCQRSYYVSNDGNDNNAGTSSQSPIKSISKVNQLGLQPGDRVLFRRNDTFRGGITLFQSGIVDKPIVVDAYGAGELPVISGSVPINNWVSLGNNVWEATCSQCGQDVTGIYDGDVALPMGRYPNLNSANRGYLTVSSHTSNNTLTSKEPLATNWVGAEVVIRANQYIIDKATVTQQQSNTLTTNNTSFYGITDGWGYFFQKHPSTLDFSGEWYYNPNTKKIRLFHDQGSPNNKFLTVAVVGEGFTTYNQSYITVRNIHITQTANIGFYAATTKNLVVENCKITNCGLDGVQINGRGNDIRFENNIINAVNNNGFQIQQYSNLLLKSNIIRNVGMIPGRGGSGDGQYIGVKSFGESNIQIEDNVIDSIGYNGITLALTNHTVQRNKISNICATKSDGAGIYMWNGNKLPMSNIKILNNIVYNSLGAPEGSIYDTYSGANGIYLDDCSQNTNLENNTVFNCIGLGIFLHATTNVTARNNTSFNNKEGQFVIAHNNDFCLTRNNTIRSNVFVSKDASQSVARYESISDDLSLYGSIDSNYYVRPFNDVITLGAGYKDGPVYVNSQVSLPEWQAVAGKDINSKTSPITYKGYTLGGFIGANKVPNGTFDANAAGWGKNDYYGNGSVEWDNTARIDGGSLKVGFSSPSGRRSSYVFAFTQIGAIESGKSYVLNFDATASMANKTVQVFIRKTYDPYNDLDVRQGVLVNTSRGQYELAFTANSSESDAIVMFRTLEDGKTLWLDNIKLREASITRQNPDDYLRLLYNPTTRDSTVLLAGRYLDAKNATYSGSVTLSPFSSLVLLRDNSTTATADASIAIRASKLTPSIGETFSMSVRVSNAGNVPVGIVWRINLPPNVELVNTNGLVVGMGTLSGSTNAVPVNGDATFTFQARVLNAGKYSMAVQVASASYPDPDSTPDSGTADGEDDADVVRFETLQYGSTMYESPNPNQRPLPPVQSGQPPVDPAKADLSLRLLANKRSAALNEIVNFTVSVANIGGAVANNVQVEATFDPGLNFIVSPGWAINSGVARATINTIAAGDTVVLSFQAQVKGNETRISSQISSASISDPDSTPGNGYANGEDDQDSFSVRFR